MTKALNHVKYVRPSPNPGDAKQATICNRFLSELSGGARLWLGARRMGLCWRERVWSHSNSKDGLSDNLEVGVSVAAPDSTWKMTNSQ